jgi:hypothetical protein
MSQVLGYGICDRDTSFAMLAMMVRARPGNLEQRKMYPKVQ